MRKQIESEGGLTIGDFTLLTWDCHSFDTEADAKEFMKNNDDKFIFSSLSPLRGECQRIWVYTRSKTKKGM